MEKFIDVLKKVWGIVAAAIGVVTTLTAFIQLWQGQRDTILWITGIVGLLILVSLLLFVGFAKKQSSVAVIGSTPRLVDRYPHLKTAARVSLVGILFISAVGAYRINEKNLELDGKEVILLTAYDGPEPQIYRVNEIVIKQLKDTIVQYDDIVILPSNETITEQVGSSAARKLGEKYRADLVIWGWYTVTATNVLVTTHIENMSLDTLVEVPASESFALQGTVAEINDFTIQQNLSDQMTVLSLYVSGLARYQLADYNGAIDRFEKIQDLGLSSEHFGDYQTVYISFGNASLKNQDLQMAEEYFQKAILISRSSVTGDDARAYLGLAQVYYMSALLPFDKSNKPGDIDVALLQEAQDTLDLALRARYQSAASNIRENIYFSRGQIIFLCAYAGASTCDLKNAVDSFEKVIASYEAGNNEIKELAGESHARLGLIYLLSGENLLAAEEYQKAAELIDNPERKDLYLERAQSFIK